MGYLTETPVAVRTSSPTPGTTDHAPVSGFCVNVAAGTVTCPGTVANAPVVSLYVYWVGADHAAPLYVTASAVLRVSNVSAMTAPSAAVTGDAPVFWITKV